ncbi:MAG: aminotransferase class I/II-fold pyridoxal phosphate-dependent enzyme [Nibricoccus sp.]
MLGGPHATAPSSATAGLHLTLVAHGIKPGDEVITTAMTFAATVNVITLVGAPYRFVDIDRGTLQMNMDEVAKKITKKTKAVIPVRFRRTTMDLDPLVELSKKHNFVIIEDAAHAVGTEYKGKEDRFYSTPRRCSHFIPTKT